MPTFHHIVQLEDLLGKLDTALVVELRECFVKTVPKLWVIGLGNFLTLEQVMNDALKKRNIFRQKLWQIYVANASKNDAFFAFFTQLWFRFNALPTAFRLTEA